MTGSQLMRLGEYYAKAIHEKYGDDFDVLFGPFIVDWQKSSKWHECNDISHKV